MLLSAAWCCCASRTLAFAFLSQEVLAELIARERENEAERAAMLANITDPEERREMERLFAEERRQAAELINTVQA